MKYDEELLNSVEIGDRVYGYDNKSDLIKAIEEIKSFEDINSEIVFIEVVEIVRGCNIYKIYDRVTCDYHWVNYVYPIGHFIRTELYTSMRNILTETLDGLV